MKAATRSCIPALLLSLLGSSYCLPADKEKVEEGRYGLLKNGGLVAGSEHSWALWQLPDGRVEVAWTIARDHPPRLELSWIEHGGPEVHQLPRHGFGTELIERGVRFELQGEAEIETVDGDLHCKIVIPANPENPIFGLPLIFGSPPDRPTSEEAAS